MFFNNIKHFIRKIFVFRRKYFRNGMNACFSTFFYSLINQNCNFM